jgi:hypothetical protein
MQTGRAHGMQTLVDAATSLVKGGIVDAEEPYARVPDRAALLGAFGRQGVAWSPKE